MADLDKFTPASSGLFQPLPNSGSRPSSTHRPNHRHLNASLTTFTKQFSNLLSNNNNTRICRRKKIGSHLNTEKERKYNINLYEKSQNATTRTCLHEHGAGAILLAVSVVLDRRVAMPVTTASEIRVVGARTQAGLRGMNQTGGTQENQFVDDHDPTDDLTYHHGQNI